ncbi:MAG: DUF4982 domain-containing protein [Lachnospiraceae bacterium]|nr:DUF4982 domain-containing protein [Lachnospiraceae bacterium]
MDNESRVLLNSDWYFRLEERESFSNPDELPSDGWMSVTLPHDWLIRDTDNLYKDGLGIYKRRIVREASGGSGQCCFVIFDGVYMNSTYFLNGVKIGEWKYGYSQYVLELTGHLKEGENELVVFVDHRSPNSRWYSGAGIYRNVWMKTTPAVYIPENGIYVHSEPDGDGYLLKCDVEIEGFADHHAAGYRTGEGIGLSTDEAAAFRDDCHCTITLKNAAAKHDGMGEERESAIGEKCVSDLSESSTGSKCSFSMYVSDPRLWDIEDPYLYELTVRLDTPMGTQIETVPLGFRNFEFTTDKGFFINGRHIKLNGVCEHHDLGLLGAEFNRSAMRRKFEILKDMGVNAIRGTHNMMAPGFVELCDEMGLLYISEAFDMWDHPKTDYDYAGFFDEWHERDVASWVRRDRNHPCLIMWSIGNEIGDIHNYEKEGQARTRELMELVRSHDYMGNGRVTQGSNYMPWENAQKCADILKVAGYNYAEKYYKKHHEEHPDWVIYGSETSSIAQSRGIYHFPLSVPTLGDDDEQCSALGNNPTSWGAKSFEECAGLDRDMEFSLGQFLWSGFDYIGEPTPYHTRSCYLGQIDTAGFPKDAYYFWKSVWTDPDKEPFVHIFPYWDFNEGQLIDVRVVSNLDEVELFLNGSSLGRQTLDHRPGSGLHMIADYSLAYEKGELTARGYKSGEEMPMAECVRRSFGDTDHLKITRYVFTSGVENDPDEIAFFEISAEDKDGNPVENACDRIRVCAEGGTLIGLDNGDSTDPDGYRTDCRRLFMGRLLAAVKPDGDPGDASIDAVIVGGVPEPRRIELVCNESHVLDKEHTEAKITAVLHPACADTDITFRVTDNAGNGTHLAELKDTAPKETTVIAKGDGRIRVRATAGSKDQPVRIISEIEFDIQGLGAAYFDPYSFISGGAFSSYIGEVSSGNDKGVATARGARTVVTYEGIDFGRFGSDRLTIPIFSLDMDQVPLKIWSGIPGEDDAELLLDTVYDKPREWNVYIEDTFALSRRLRGICTISFEVEQKIHIKGFKFERGSAAGVSIPVTEADSISGDSFERLEDRVEHIGNNVSIVFKNMDLGTEGIDGIRIIGRTPNETNPVHVRFYNGTDEIKEVAEFKQSGEYISREFKLPHLTRTWDLSFVFLPGSNFDFESFEFTQG